MSLDAVSVHYSRPSRPALSAMTDSHRINRQCARSKRQRLQERLNLQLQIALDDSMAPYLPTLNVAIDNLRDEIAQCDFDMR